MHIGASEEITEREDFGKSLKDMPRAIWAMLCNTPFLFTTLAGCSEGFIVAAFTAFLPKYIESQFSLTAGEAAFYAGINISAPHVYCSYVCINENVAMLFLTSTSIKISYVASFSSRLSDL